MMTTAPTRYTIEFMEPPSSPTGSQSSRVSGAVGSWTDEAPSHRGAVSPGASESMQSQIQPGRPGARPAHRLLNRGVGRTAVLHLRGGVAALRPRSRSASDPSDGDAAGPRDRGRSSFGDSGLEGGGLEAEERCGAGWAADPSTPRQR